MKKAIINYINAIAEKLRPCKHDWELISKRKANLTINPNYVWTEWTYRCRKCGEKNFIKNEED